MKFIGSNNQKKMTSRNKTPFKLRCIFGCSRNVDPNSVLINTVPKPSKVVHSAKVNDESNNIQDSDKEVFGEKKNDNVNEKLEYVFDDEKEVVLGWKIGRNYSMGVGKIGSIDEDQPCEFKEVDVKRYFYPRSQSFGYSKQNLVH